MKNHHGKRVCTYMYNRIIRLHRNEHNAVNQPSKETPHTCSYWGGAQGDATVFNQPDIQETIQGSRFHLDEQSPEYLLIKFS